ncbi:PaaX family transcriptional regulator C-terminal domain-containing protein [Mesobacterium pallidum]|uniref:PaaX family transcriptional regulator C-terminal domain-containing protein n=1 Tax=Mesobacterium pallidum TaxID=2872037 RepID=UPI001EE20493|nr:PaaX family transcriptional regulator C-terminal domain-containing protein [Mesobacterium pallidum]
MSTAKTLAHLQGLGTLKAWSVVVTILGDLCQAETDRISGRLLDRLVGPMGISNQTLRVALHRLRRDGWVISEKSGRSSNYGLSAPGWAMTVAARPVIYPAPGAEADPVNVVIAPPGLSAADFAESLPDEAVQLSARSALAPGEEFGDEALVVPFAAEKLPDWVAAQIAPAALCAEYAALARAVPQSGWPEAMIEAVTLRLLILHQWRRLRLRHGPLPDQLLPHWDGALARTRVMTALSALPRPTLVELEGAA